MAWWAWPVKGPSGRRERGEGSVEEGGGGGGQAAQVGGAPLVIPIDWLINLSAQVAAGAAGTTVGTTRAGPAIGSSVAGEKERGTVSQMWELKRWARQEDVEEKLQPEGGGSYFRACKAAKLIFFIKTSLQV